MAYDRQYRARVIEYLLEGHTYDETSGIFKVGKTSIERWLSSYRATGTAG
ncbi:MAG: transposase, partial [Fibromonadaceae bacterium]|nr:transposase [Fibromonadaceae bacterium]